MTVRTFSAKTGKIGKERRYSYDVILIDAECKLFFREGDTVAPIHLNLADLGSKYYCLKVAEKFLDASVAEGAKVVEVVLDPAEELVVDIYMEEPKGEENVFAFTADTARSIEGSVTLVNHENIEYLLVNAENEERAKEVQGTPQGEEEQQTEPPTSEPNQIVTPEQGVQETPVHTAPPVQQVENTQAAELARKVEEVTKEQEQAEQTATSSSESVVSQPVEQPVQTAQEQPPKEPKQEDQAVVKTNEEQPVSVPLEPKPVPSTEEPKQNENGQQQENPLIETSVELPITELKVVTIQGESLYSAERDETAGGVQYLKPQLKNKTLGIYSIENFTVNFLTLQGVQSLALNADSKITVDAEQSKEFTNLVENLWALEVEHAELQERDPLIQNLAELYDSLD